MKLIILGSTGLLGNTITKYFFENPKYKTKAIIRDSTKKFFFKNEYQDNFLTIKNILDFSVLEKHISAFMPDLIINCIGVTNKFSMKKLIYINESILINAYLPNKLYEICSKFRIRLIQFSTDCVFSGKKGNYTEKDNPDPLDIYGKSKLLGEINFENSITIRKSVIGHELASARGLLEWFLCQENSVNGFQNVLFSGLTVLELARIIEIYIIPKKNLRGVIHISGNTISKYDLLEIISKVYKKSIKIIPNQTVKIDRSLNCDFFKELTNYQAPAWTDLIQSMYNFNKLSE